MDVKHDQVDVASKKTEDCFHSILTHSFLLFNSENIISMYIMYISLIHLSQYILKKRKQKKSFECNFDYKGLARLIPNIYNILVMNDQSTEIYFMNVFLF
jgi:hypothetical protein